MCDAEFPMSIFAYSEFRSDDLGRKYKGFGSWVQKVELKSCGFVEEAHETTLNWYKKKWRCALYIGKK